MGMSASQARLIALTARMNDIEYQGQQINQQRTTLSSQVNALYNSLLEMDVPTPPSTTDYTKIVYKGIDNASSFKIGNIVPHGTEYSVDLIYTKTGHGITDAGTVTASYVSPKIKVAEVPESDIYTPAQEAKNETWSAHQAADDETPKVGTNIFRKGSGAAIGDDVYILKDGIFEKVKYSDTTQDYYVMTQVKAGEEEDTTDFNKDTDYIIDKQESKATPATAEKAGVAVNWNQIYIKESNGTLRHANEGDFDWQNNRAYFKKDMAGLYVRQSATGNEVDNPDAQSGKLPYVINGNNCMNLDEAYNLGYFTSSSEYDSIKESITNTYPDKKPEDFVVYFTTEGGNGKLVPHFIAKESFSILDKNNNGTTQVANLDYIANGQYTSTQSVDGCKLVFDNSGRITDIEIPRYDENNKLTGYTKVSLEAVEEKDTAAYDNAFNQYTYQKSLYDKQQQEINAKTSIIQAEDKNLELKLTRLDNERNAVNTEIEAVKKVVDDNIQKSFKTFSG